MDVARKRWETDLFAKIRRQEGDEILKLRCSCKEKIPTLLRTLLAQDLPRGANAPRQVSAHICIHLCPAVTWVVGGCLRCGLGMRLSCRLQPGMTGRTGYQSFRCGESTLSRPPSDIMRETQPWELTVALYNLIILTLAKNIILLKSEINNPHQIYLKIYRKQHNSCSLIFSTMSSSSPPSPPPLQSHALLSYPDPSILLVTLNRPLAMNALPFKAHWDLSQLWSWFDASPTLLVAILTGAGSAFCAGQDLKEVQANRLQPPSQPYLAGRPPSGFGGMSQRRGRKPIIAAVNGVAFGGGFEMCLNW